MGCSKCNAEVNKDKQYCLYCGEKIKAESKADNISNDNLTNEKSDDKKVEPDKKENAEQVSEKVLEIVKELSKKAKNAFDIAKEKALPYWNKMDMFCKIESVSMVISVILLIIALCNGKALPIIFSILQIGGLSAAFVLHKDILKCNKEWAKKVVIIVTIIIAIINISSYSWNFAVKVDTPYAAKDCIGKDKDEIKDDFELAGFSNVSEEIIYDLDIEDANKYGVVEGIYINGISDFKGNKKFKNSAKVIIEYHDFKCVGVPISSDETKDMEAETIKKAFEEAGFIDVITEEVYDLDPDETDVTFENCVYIAENDIFDKGDELPLNSEVKIITHRPYEKYTLNVDIVFIPNLIFSKYDVKFQIDEYEENLSHGKDAEFEYRLKKGKYTLTFCSEESDSVKGSAEIDLTGDTNVSYEINCHSDKVSVDTLYIENKSAIGENEAMVPYTDYDCEDKNYKTIKKAFKEAGFTNITTEILYDIVWGFTDEGDVEKVSINGVTDFVRGDIFAKDSEIVITYHMKEEDDPNRVEDTESEDVQLETEENEPTSYSTNDYETAKEGNTGIFSYKSKSGAYDVYWIIDFDEGYVYWFTDGNGENYCDKLKIESGNLNNKIIITWKDSGEEWSHSLHFKYVNTPTTLVVNDQNGFANEYWTTNLKDALSIRDTKTIKEY